MNPTLLRNRRKALGYTQARLAEAADVDIRTIGRAEAGHPIAAETLVALRSVLGLEVDEVQDSPPDHAAQGEFTVIRPGKHQDQVGLLTDIRAALRGVPGVHTVVLPDCSVRHKPWRPVSFGKHTTPGLAAFTAFVSVPGGGAFVLMLNQLGFPVIPKAPSGMLMHFAASMAFLALILVWFWRMDIRVEARIYRNTLRFLQNMRLEATSGRAYAFGDGTIHLITVSADTIDRRELRIDAKRAVERGVNDDTVSYSVPTHDGRVSLQFLPSDPRIDALLMRDAAAWGCHSVPRSSAVAVAAT